MNCYAYVNGGNMATLTNFLSKIDLNNLITIFDIQIAIALVIIAFLAKGVVARIIIGIVYKFTKNPKKARESEMYAPIKQMFVMLAFYIALYIIPKGERLAYIINEIFKVVIIIFFTKFITTMIHSDSRFLKKFFRKSENDKVNEFLCKIMRGLVWIISIFIIISELGFLKDLSSLITGLGLVSAIIALAAQELVKNLLSRSINSY
jgi:small-conductance mechanosensitive channel